MPALQQSSSSPSYPTTAAPATSYGITPPSQSGSCTPTSLIQATPTNNTHHSVESNMGIIAGSLPTLKPLFKQILGTYGSQSKTRRYTYGSKQYRLQSISPSYPQPSVRSRPLSVLDPDDLEEGDPRAAQRNSKYGTTTTKYHYRDGSHTSEEYILTRQESAGIVLTTEVVVTHTMAEEVIRNNRGKRTQPPNEKA